MFEDEIDNLQRVREILGKMMDAGFTEIVDRTGLREKLPFGKKFFRDGDYSPGPVRLREVFEDLGPTFIKLGQMLAQRPDIIPESYVEEMEKLEEDVEPVDTGEIKKIIEESLGRGVEEVFESFEETPEASASIAQVHKALLDGEEVAVKVVKPGVRKTILTDLRILSILFREIEDTFSSLKKYHLEDMFDQFRNWTRNEIDLRKEAENMETVSSNFSKDRYVYIPEVCWEETSRDVLTMEFIEGARMEAGELEDAGHVPEDIAEKGIELVLDMVLRDGMFHGDPHPSNMRVDEEGRIVLFDFGIVGRIDRRTRQKLSVVLLYALEQDVDGVLRALKDIADFENVEDEEEFRRDIEKTIMKNPESRIGNNLVSMDFLEIVRKGASNGIVFPTNLVSGGKSLVQAEGLGMKICPDFKPFETVRKKIRRILIRENSPLSLGRGLAASLVENRELIENAPRHVMEVLESLKSVNKLSLEEPINFSSKDIAVAIFGSVVLLSGSLTLSLAGNPYVRLLGLGEILAGIVIGWFILTE